MFKYKYYIWLNGEKTLVALRPHWTTYIKAFAPAVVIWGTALTAFSLLAKEPEESYTEDTVVTFD